MFPELVTAGPDIHAEPVFSLLKSEFAVKTGKHLAVPQLSTWHD